MVASNRQVIVKEAVSLFITQDVAILKPRVPQVCIPLLRAGVGQSLTRNNVAAIHCRLSTSLSPKDVSQHRLIQLVQLVRLSRPRTMSCEVCQEVLGNLTHSAKRVKSPHHGSAASFKQSVDQGCYTCCTLWEYLTVTEKNGLADHETGAALTTAEIVDHKDEHGPYGALDTWSFQSDSLETLNVPFVFFFRSLSPGTSFRTSC